MCFRLYLITSFLATFMFYWTYLLSLELVFSYNGFRLFKASQIIFKNLWICFWFSNFHMVLFCQKLDTVFRKIQFEKGMCMFSTMKFNFTDAIFFALLKLSVSLDIVYACYTNMIIFSKWFSPNVFIHVILIFMYNLVNVFHLIFLLLCFFFCLFVVVVVFCFCFALLFLFVFPPNGIEIKTTQQTNTICYRCGIWSKSLLYCRNVYESLRRQNISEERDINKSQKRELKTKGNILSNSKNGCW